jgi:hypothetical protein
MHTVSQSLPKSGKYLQKLASPTCHVSQQSLEYLAEQATPTFKSLLRVHGTVGEQAKRVHTTGAHYCAAHQTGCAPAGQNTRSVLKLETPPASPSEELAVMLSNTQVSSCLAVGSPAHLFLQAYGVAPHQNTVNFARSSETAARYGSGCRAKAAEKAALTPAAATARGTAMHCV